MKNILTKSVATIFLAASATSCSFAATAPAQDESNIGISFGLTGGMRMKGAYIKDITNAGAPAAGAPAAGAAAPAIGGKAAGGKGGPTPTPAGTPVVDLDDAKKMSFAVGGHLGVDIPMGEMFDITVGISADMFKVEQEEKVAVGAPAAANPRTVSTKAIRIALAPGVKVNFFSTEDMKVFAKIAVTPKYNIVSAETKNGVFTGDPKIENLNHISVDGEVGVGISYRVAEGVSLYGMLSAGTDGLYRFKKKIEDTKVVTGTKHEINLADKIAFMPSFSAGVKINM